MFRRGCASVTCFAVTRILALTVMLLAALPAAALARAPASAPAIQTEDEDIQPSGTRLDDAAQAAVFPIDGRWAWGGPRTGFGERGGGHDGEDVFAACGTPLVAAEGGRVVFTGTEGSAGNYLVVRTAADGEHQVYMHLDRAPRHRQGETVATGERLGAVGRSGNASACHLHFEIWTAPGWYRGGRARDPHRELARWAGRAAAAS